MLGFLLVNDYIVQNKLAKKSSEYKVVISSTTSTKIMYDGIKCFFHAFSKQ